MGIIAIINQRFSIGINEDLLNLESGNQTSELQQYKSKPSSLENALKLRYMPSLKLNYSSGAFSRALLHNKSQDKIFWGRNILNSLHTLSWRSGRLGWSGLLHFVPKKKHLNQRPRALPSSVLGFNITWISYEFYIV